MSKLIDLTDQTFGRLTALEIKGRDCSGAAMWKCQCTCGNTKTISGSNLRAGRTKSCGCLQKERATTHGMTKTSEYPTWADMKRRCINPNHAAYKYYGGRGITVCKEWLHSFETFFKDMGERPSGLTLERIDNDKGYYLENCIWATPTEQGRNRGLYINNPSGFVGVYWREERNRWVVFIGANNKTIYLGDFSNLEDAINARKEGEKRYWNNETCKGRDSRIGT